MSPWPFVIAAYALVALASAGLTLWSLVALRHAEAAAEAVRQRK